MKGSPCPELRLEILQLKIRSLISEILRKIWKHGFGSRSRTVIRINTKTRTAMCRIRVHIWVEFGGWMWCGFGDLRWQLRVRKKRIITRMLLLQATVKKFQFDLYVNLEGQQMLISSWFQKISLLEQIRWIKLHKAWLNHQIFMILGHNVLIYCS